MKLFNPAAASLTLATFLFSAASLANPDLVKKELDKKFPDMKAQSVNKTRFGNLYEVFTGSEILYTDEKVSFLVLGNIVDTQTRANVTESRLQKLSAINFDELPFEQGMKLVRGKGERRMVIFEDPNCGYCKRFEQDLNQLENVTAYIFPYPILAPDSSTKAKSIWCASDRLKTWQDWMLRAQAPVEKTDCDNPVDKNLALGQKLRVNSIPTTFFEDGERLTGALPKAAFEAKLAEASRRDSKNPKR